MYGYQDLIVDPRSLIQLQSDTNLVSMDINIVYNFLHKLGRWQLKREDYVN